MPDSKFTRADELLLDVLTAKIDCGSKLTKAIAANWSPDQLRKLKATLRFDPRKLPKSFDEVVQKDYLQSLDSAQLLSDQYEKLLEQFRLLITADQRLHLQGWLAALNDELKKPTTPLTRYQAALYPLLVRKLQNLLYPQD